VSIRDVPARRLPRGLVDMYQEFSFGGTLRDGGWSYDTMSEWARNYNTIASAAYPLIEDLTDKRLAAAELEYLEKGRVSWRDVGLGALVQFSEPRAVDPDQARLLRPRFQRLGREYANWIRRTDRSTLRHAFLSDNVVLAKGKGAPYWFSSLETDAAIALGKLALTGRTIHELDDLVLNAGSAMMGMVITTYMRVQGGRKPRPVYVRNGKGLTQLGERLGPKVRRVQAMPYAYNYLAVGVAGVLKAGLRARGNQNTGDIIPALDLARSFKHGIALDFAAYDEHVAGETLLEWGEFVYEPQLTALVEAGLITATRKRLLMDIHEYTVVMPQLGPPAFTNCGAREVDTYGMIKSGMRLTSHIGTEIGREYNELKMMHLGISGKVVNWGDDTVVFTNDNTAHDKYAAKEKWFGLDQTVAEDTSFLMRRIPGGYTYFSRMLMGSLNKEVRFEPRNLFHAAGAMRIRHDLLTGHPLQDRFLPILASCGGRMEQAARLAGSASALELLSGAAAFKMGEGEYETFLDVVDELPDVSGSDKRRLQAVALTQRRRKTKWAPPGRVEMSLAESLNLMRTLTPADAAEWIGANSYARRPGGSYAH